MREYNVKAISFGNNTYLPLTKPTVANEGQTLRQTGIQISATSKCLVYKNLPWIAEQPLTLKHNLTIVEILTFYTYNARRKPKIYQVLFF